MEEDKKQGTADYDKDERQAKDFQRSKSHDALISDITSLRRNMAEKGIDTSWADNLFDNSEPNRNAIKTFAVKTAYYLVKKAMRQVESE